MVNNWISGYVLNRLGYPTQPRRVMASRNPVLIRATGEQIGATNQFSSDGLGNPRDHGLDARMTLDDVIVKTGMLFAVLLVGAYFGWTSVVGNPSIMMIAMVIGLVLAITNSYKREVSPALVLAYGAAQGVFIGGLSRFFNDAFAEKAPNLVSQAVLGTLVAFGVMLFMYKTGVIKVNAKFVKVFMISMVSYLVISVASFISTMVSSGSNWGFFGAGSLGMILCMFGVALASFSLVMDFEMIQQGIQSGLPEKESWRMAFGLTVSLVWLYTELLRLLAIFSDR